MSFFEFFMLINLLNTAQLCNINYQYNYTQFLRKTQQKNEMCNVFVALHIWAGIYLLILPIAFLFRVLFFLFYPKHHPQQTRNEPRIVNKYNFHNYLRKHVILTNTSAAAATTSTHLVGNSDATSRPSPKNTEARILFFLHLTLSPSTILRESALCVLEICALLQYDNSGDEHEDTSNR